MELISVCKFCKSSGKMVVVVVVGIRNLCHMSCAILNVSIPAALRSDVYHIGVGTATQYQTVLSSFAKLVCLKLCVCECVCVYCM